jgi:Flp pilus assembly protein TadG
MKDARRRATALVETAIVLPLLMYLLLAMIEYSYVYYTGHRLSNAARTGARVAATSNATDAQVRSAISTLMAQAGLTTYSVDISSIDPGNYQPLTVTVSVACAGNSQVDVLGLSGVTIGAANWLFPLPANLSASCTMAKEP